MEAGRARFRHREDSMNRTFAAAFAAVTLLSSAAAFPAATQAQELTLCWAAWDPANALVELS